MLYTFSKPLGIWFPTSGANPDFGSPLDRAFLIILMSIALWILIRRRFDWSNAINENAWLMVLIVYMLVSILWSNIPTISFKRWIRELQAILMAFFVLSELSPRQAMESIFRRIAYILIPFSLLLIKYFPKYGVNYGRWVGGQMWIGVSTQKNGLGRLCFVVVFFLIWSLVRRWQGHKALVWKYENHIEIFVLAIALWLLKGPGGITYSATSIISLAVGLLFYGGFYFIKKSGKNLAAGTLMAIVGIVIIFGIVAIFTGGSNVGYLAASAKRDATLTGRTAAWAALLPVAMQSPLAGRGFGGFWTSGTKGIYNISGAHSGYLDMLLGLGFLGILLISLFLLTSCRKAQRELKQNFDWGALWFCYIIMIVVHNIVESSIDSLASPLTAVILFITISSTNVFLRRQQA